MSLIEKVLRVVIELRKAIEPETIRRQFIN